MLGWSAATSPQPTTPAHGAGLLQLTGRILILEAMVGQHNQQLKDTEAAGRATAGRVDTLTGELNLYAAQLGQGRATMEEKLGGHLVEIEGTLRKCDGRENAAAVSIHRSSGCSLTECLRSGHHKYQKSLRGDEATRGQGTS